MADDYFVRMNDLEAAEMLKQMAKMDLRTIGDQNAWLIRQAWAMRANQLNQTTIAQTQAIISDLSAGETK